MGIFSVISVFVMALIPSANCNNSPSRDQSLNSAIEEMQRANYFSFIMLLNIAPPDKIRGNITFLIPNNRILAKTVIPTDEVLDFLLRHSIPTPLGFDALRHFPTGSMIPSSEAGFMLKVSNSGWKSFFLNDVKIVSPNVCVSGSSVRCHGIDGVLNRTLPPFTPPALVAPPPALPSRPHSGGYNSAPQPAGLNPGPRNSGLSTHAFGGGLLECLSKWVILSMLWCYL